mgnify:CR=1 FL=1
MPSLSKFKQLHEPLLLNEGFAKVFDLPHKIRYRRGDGTTIDIEWDTGKQVLFVVTTLPDATIYHSHISLEDKSGIFKRIVGRLHDPTYR